MCEHAEKLQAAIALRQLHGEWVSLKIATFMAQNAFIVVICRMKFNEQNKKQFMIIYMHM